MSWLTFRAGILCSAALFTAPALAAPVTYVETSGDLPGFDPLPVFTFDLGVNTISGSFLGGFDSFAFIVPAGLTLEGGSLVLTDVSGNITSSFWDLYAGSSLRFQTDYVDTLGGSSPGTDTIPALPAGLYNVTHHTINGTGETAFVFTFTIIPEPASAAILGLSSLALLTRRRSR